MSGFWRTWMTGWCGAVGLFGLLLAAGAFEATGAPIRLLFEILNPSAAFEPDPPLRFSLAVLGAVTLGWSVTLLAAIRAAILLGEAAGPIWRLILASTVIWYVSDSVLSVATGYGLNIIPNTVFLAAFLLPLVQGGALAASRTGAVHQP